ncbi:MAG: hypothetical protein MUO27_08780 [Sedimentisphaerales bacterium]|nr:hypothetical protein [Sedimentisphaerales bacterium]
MQLLEILRWIVTGVFALIGGWIIAANYAVAILWFLRRKRGSLLPIVGGVLFALAMFRFPLLGVRKWAWLPLVLDLGCLFSVLCFLYSVFVLKCLKK